MSLINRHIPFVRYRTGFLLVGFIIWLLSSFFYLKKIGISKEPVLLTLDSVAMRRLDSLKQFYEIRKKPKIYPFNPNYLTDYRAYMLGIDTLGLKRIRTFREKGGYFKNKKHFKEISGISDSLFEILAPYIKITSAKRFSTFRSTNFYPAKKKSEPIIIKDINTATAEDLKRVYGIGEVLSKRIIKYRNKLGGFTIKDQLKDVYALSPEAYRELWKYFEIASPAPVSFQINLNTADMQELQKNPYIDIDLSEKIVEYRSLKGKFKSLEDLKKIEGFPEEKYERIILYLRLK